MCWKRVVCWRGLKSHQKKKYGRWRKSKCVCFSEEELTDFFGNLARYIIFFFFSIRSIKVSKLSTKSTEELTGNTILLDKSRFVVMIIWYEAILYMSKPIYCRILRANSTDCRDKVWNIHWARISEGCFPKTREVPDALHAKAVARPSCCESKSPAHALHGCTRHWENNHRKTGGR